MILGMEEKEERRQALLAVFCDERNPWTWGSMNQCCLDFNTDGTGGVCLLHFASPESVVRPQLNRLELIFVVRFYVARACILFLPSSSTGNSWTPTHSLKLNGTPMRAPRMAYSGNSRLKSP